MRRLVTIAAGVSALASAAGCITHSPRRTIDITDLSVKPPVVCEMLPNSSTIDTSRMQLTGPGPAGETHRDEVGCVSHERHVPTTNAAAERPHEGFDLHVVEYDDEGQPWNGPRLDETMSMVREQLEDPALVVMFVHGWKNDASVCNGNISCFRDMLEIFAKGERAYADVAGREPRRVIGVYVGWRGGTLKPTLIKQLTFWGRKHTAHAIGDNGGVTSLIGRIRWLVQESGPRRRAMEPRAQRGLPNTSLVLIGHSFGAALLFSALATSLNADVGAAIEQAIPRDQPTARDKSPAQALLTTERRDGGVLVDRQGDLILLVNPAMEASRFSSLNQASLIRYDATQVPIFMTLSSEADSAVGGFFPVGQSFSTVLRAARSRAMWFSMVSGLGWYPPYYTHRLNMKLTTPAPEPDRVRGECRCSSNLWAFGDALITRLEPLYRLAASAAPVPGDLKLAAHLEFLHSRFEPLRDIDPHNPFLTVHVDRQVLTDHSGIFTPAFMDFLIEYIIRSEVKRQIVGAFGQRAKP